MSSEYVFSHSLQFTCHALAMSVSCRGSRWTAVGRLKQLLSPFTQNHAICRCQSHCTPVAPSSMSVHQQQLISLSLARCNGQSTLNAVLVSFLLLVLLPTDLCYLHYQYHYHCHYQLSQQYWTGKCTHCSVAGSLPHLPSQPRPALTRRRSLLRPSSAPLPSSVASTASLPAVLVVGRLSLHSLR